MKTRFATHISNWRVLFSFRGYLILYYPLHYLYARRRCTASISLPPYNRGIAQMDQSGLLSLTSGCSIPLLLRRYCSCCGGPTGSANALSLSAISSAASSLTGPAATGEQQTGADMSTVGSVFGMVAVCHGY